MGKTLYVGNLPYSTNDDELYDVFEKHGGVDNVRVIKDRETGRSKGFGFVEMMTEEEADAAMKALDGKDLGGRPLRVSQAVNNMAKTRPGGDRRDSGGRDEARGGDRRSERRSEHKSEYGDRKAW